MQRMDASNHRQRIDHTLQAFRETCPWIDSKSGIHDWLVKVGFDQEDILLAALGQSRSEVQADCGFSVMGKGTRDQESLQLSRGSQFPQPHPQKPIAVGAWAARIRVKGEPGFR
jgi:hypothetical protein